jgi:ribosome-associated heat shock protein Hsp15
MRIDKWLWAARFFKTRALAQTAIEGGRVKVAGERVKPAKELRRGEQLQITLGDMAWEIVVAALSERRGPASVARTLYEETEASRAAREAKLDALRLQIEPARGLKGRPTKRDRRALDRLRDG